MLHLPHRRRNIKKLAAPAIYANVQSHGGEQVKQRDLLFVYSSEKVRVRDQTAVVMNGNQFAKHVDERNGRGSFYGIANTDYDVFTRQGMNKEGKDSGFVACVAGMTTVFNESGATIIAGTLLRVAVHNKTACFRHLKKGEVYADAKAVTTARKDMQMDIILRPAYRYPGNDDMLNWK
jgi:hypothetical protein